ncbi:MAG: gamma-glutamyltranspeptidase/glutathione hydrolase [Candidatus Azotimanducaceae bacterium]|jgi:gamma-glutamyltranspeptidase/glutathione hydrolase
MGTVMQIIQQLVVILLTGALFACAAVVEPLPVPLDSPPQKVIAGRQGMAVAAQPEATKAAVSMLAKGGNAADAAVAAGFAISVLEPTMNSIGGRSQVLVRTAAGEYMAINGMTEIPAGYERPEVPDRNGYGVIATPGVVAALAKLHEKQGSLPWAEVLAPAIDLAQNGFVMLPGEAARHALGLRSVQDNPGFQQNILRADGSTYPPGALFKQPALANTLKVIARDGAQAFYQGGIADEIAADMAANGGNVTLADLNGYEALDGRYISTSYRDVEIHTIAAPAGGGLVVKALNILENFEMSQLNDLEWAAVMNQALALSVRTMENDYEERDLGQVTSKVWAAETAQQVKVPDIQLPEKALLNGAKLASLEMTTGVDWAGDSWGEDSHHTTHFVTADCAGMTVSITQTVGPLFGSKVMTPALGFAYASTMGSYLAASAQSPGSRPRTTIAPTVVTRDVHGEKEVVMVLGAAGGLRILSGIVQIISRVVDQNMTLEDAVAAPRIHPSTRTNLETGARIIELKTFHAELTARNGWQRADLAVWDAAGFEAKPNDRDAAFARVHALGREGGLWRGAADLDWEGSALTPVMANCPLN